MTVHERFDEQRNSHATGEQAATKRRTHLVLLEGGAEYVGELISGQVTNVHLQDWTRGRECALGREFLADRDGTDLSRWLYNGPGDDDRRGDLGYWIGHRIARAYVDAADDRQQATVELLDVRPETAAALFEASGWVPACAHVTPRTATSPAPRRSDAADPAG